MNRMFKGCKSLKELNVSSFSVSEDIVVMNEMFSGCESLEVLDLTSFGVLNDNCLNGIFGGCDSLKVLHYKISGIKQFGLIAESCKSLKRINDVEINQVMKLLKLI